MLFDHSTHFCASEKAEKFYRLGTGIHQHQRAEALWMIQNRPQSDHASHGMAEQIAALDLQQIEQADQICGQLLQ